MSLLPSYIKANESRARKFWPFCTRTAKNMRANWDSVMFRRTMTQSRSSRKSKRHMTFSRTPRNAPCMIKWAISGSKTVGRGMRAQTQVGFHRASLEAFHFKEDFRTVQVVGSVPMRWMMCCTTWQRSFSVEVEGGRACTHHTRYVFHTTASYNNNYFLFKQKCCLLST